MEAVKYEPEECAWCKGRRKAPYGETCQVCKGKGAVLVSQPSRVCLGCRGAGHEGGFSDLPMCQVCVGTGWRGVRQERG